MYSCKEIRKQCYSLSPLSTQTEHQENGNALRNCPNCIAYNHCTVGRVLALIQVRLKIHQCQELWHCNSGHYSLDRKAFTRNTVAYSFFTILHGMASRWIDLQQSIYLMRTVLQISESLMATEQERRCEKANVPFFGNAFFYSVKMNLHNK